MEPNAAHGDAVAAWIAHDALPFALSAPGPLNAAIDTMITALGPNIELLGFGEALHGGQESLLLRNLLFQRLVEAHGYCAIAIESGFAKGSLVNAYINGQGSAAHADYAAIESAGFSHGFGTLEANRELIAWMRAYNADPAHTTRLRFYGFDIPQGAMLLAGPHQVLRFALAYLATLDNAAAHAQRDAIEPLLGDESAWENLESIQDPSKSLGLTPAAMGLRLATENLIAELRRRRPELVAGSSADAFAEALHYAVLARALLNYHAAQARGAAPPELLGLRDAVMADNLDFIVRRERGRGKVLAFAHNAHVQRGKFSAMARWAQALGSEGFSWWPAGAQIHETLGARYAVIGAAIGQSEENGIAPPEPDTLEARLAAGPLDGCLIPTHGGNHLPAAVWRSLPLRDPGTLNLSYNALNAQSVRDFDWLALLKHVTYTRGAPPLQQWTPPDASETPSSGAA